MIALTRSPRVTSRVLRTSALCTALLSVPVASSAQGVVLEQHPNRLFQFETANMYPAGTLELNVGTMQTDPSGTGGGTGNQVYFGGASYAVNDKLTFGFDVSTYQDPVIKPINGSFPDFVVDTAAIWGKVRLFDNGQLSIAAQGSVETFVRLESPIFGGANSGVVIGSLKLPMTYTVSPKLQFHLTPGVSVFPDTVGGTTFYGTIPTLGAGVSYKPNDRLALFGAVDVPIGTGNTISNTATYTQVPVYTAGGRYNITPKVALTAYVTNGVGITPATSILTHWPDGDTLMAGLKLVYTPGAKRPESYRGAPAPITARQGGLQQDGFTLGSPDTLEPGTFAVGGWYGSNENAGGMLSFSPDRDGEINVIVEQYANDGSVAAALTPSTKPRYMIGPKLRFLDQNNGDPFSLAGRVLFGRQIESGVPGIGVFFAEGIASYKVNEKVTLTANPKVAAFGGTEAAGLGLGLNIELFDGLDLIAEATAVGADATTATWAAGVRYNVPGAGLSIDANASNAIGRYGIGTMIAQDSVKYSISLTKRFNVGGWR